MNGTDRAVQAIMNYSKNGLGKELDKDYLNDNIQIYLLNDKSLYNGVHNTRRPAHSVAYEGLLTTINKDNNENLTSPQIKAGFKQLGLDFKEVIKPTVEFIEEQRKEDLEESTKVTESTDIDKLKAKYVGKQIFNKDEDRIVTWEEIEKEFNEDPDKTAYKDIIEYVDDYILGMNSNCELQDVKMLNEERYYYGEIENIKDNLTNLNYRLKDIRTTVASCITNKDNEYSKEQEESLDSLSLWLETLQGQLDKSCNGLAKAFPNRIRMATPEEKEYIEKHKDEIPMEESKKEELFDVSDEVKQDSINKGLYSENKKVTESKTIFSTYETNGIEESEAVWEDYENVIVPEIAEQCRNDVLIMAGTVGRWNGQFTGGTVLDVDDLPSFGDVDDIEIVVDNENVFWKGIHHDGTHIMQLFTIPEDEEARKRICKDLGIVEWLQEMYEYNTEEECMEDALSRLDDVKDLEDIFGPEEFEKANKYFTPIKATGMLSESKKVTEAEEDNSGISTTVPKLTPEQEKEVEDQFYKDEEDTTFHNEDGTEKTILDYLEERIGQQMSVGEFNTTLQSIFGQYNKVFLQIGDLYNANLDETQDLVVWDEDVMYTIKYDIVSLEDSLIEITDIDEEY